MYRKVAHHYRAARRAIRTHRLHVALFVAIGATLVLTVISLTIYKVGGFYRYDLSRPGYEKERKEVTTPSPDVSYDTTSPLSKQGVDTFIKPLDAHRKNFEAYNAFGNGGLSDEDLRITGNVPTALQ
jgi:hypothetical protein